MPRKPNPDQFEFVENPEKNLAPSTLISYKRYLNQLAKEGFKNKEDLLNHSVEVVKTIGRLGDTKVKRNFLYGAVFYITGKMDFQEDPRGLPLFRGFQENYKANKNTSSE